MRKIRGDAIAFHFSPEQPMTRRKPRAWNGKGGKQTGFRLPEGKPGADPVVDGSVPCRRFAACKRSLNLCGSRNSGKITTGHLSHPQFHLSLLGSLALLRTEAPGG